MVEENQNSIDKKYSNLCMNWRKKTESWLWKYVGRKNLLVGFSGEKTKS